MRGWEELPFKRCALTVSSLRAYYLNEALRLADFGQGCAAQGMEDRGPRQEEVQATLHEAWA